LGLSLRRGPYLWPGFCLRPSRRSVLLLAQWLGCNRVLRVSAVRLGKRCSVGLCGPLVLRLEPGRSRMLIALGNPVLWGGSVLNSARAAVIGNAAAVGDRVSLHNRRVVVSSANDALIHAHDRGVVSKLAAAPFSARETNAPVPKAVVHAAVVADVAAPVAPMEPVSAAVPVPVVGRPQSSFIGSRNPSAGNPVVVSLAVGPVAWNPHQVGLRTEGLLINGQLGRSETHTYDDLCVRRSGNDRDKQCQQKPTRSAEQLHEKNLLVLSCLPCNESRLIMGGGRALAQRRQEYPASPRRSGQICTAVSSAPVFSSPRVSLRYRTVSEQCDCGL
jgi:hypothetical protein